MKPKTNYFENLDALRFFSFFSVFLYHNFHTNNLEVKASKFYQVVKFKLIENGGLGVNFFFVLSGFLITYLLLIEKKRTGNINLKNFYLKRVLRIWPLFYFCVFFGFVIFPFIKSLFGESSNEHASFISYLFFFNNIDLINNGSPDSSILTILWSVAIEEQFYLIWPILIGLISYTRLPILFFSIISLSLVFRYFNTDLVTREFHSLSCIGDMAVGGFSAYLILYKKQFKRNIELLPKAIILIVYLMVILIYFFRHPFILMPIVGTFERFFVAIIFALVILEQNYSENSLFKFGKLKHISDLGIITYGLYCLHQIALLTTTKLAERFHLDDSNFEVFFIQGIFSLLFSILLAKLSYKYFEQPFLKFKEKLI